jgi:hypothetical protein
MAVLLPSPRTAASRSARSGGAAARACLLQSVHEGRGVASGSPAGAHRPRRGGLGLTHQEAVARACRQELDAHEGRAVGVYDVAHTHGILSIILAVVSSQREFPRVCMRRGKGGSRFSHKK